MRAAASRALGLVAASACLGAVTVAAHTLVNTRLLRDPYDALRAASPARTAHTSTASPARTADTSTASPAPPADTSAASPAPGQQPPSEPPVSVLVPARDEAERIGACVQSVLASRRVRLELLVLDDGSSDGTARAAYAAAGCDLRLRVLRGRPLPPGWLGKPHACAQLAEAARGDVLVFVDADVRLEPDGLAATVAQLDAGPFALVSPYPRQEADSVGTRLVQPLLQWSWLASLPLRAAERWPRPSLVAANGQLLATTRAAYDAVGGHAAIRAEVLDDMELARAYLRAGRPAGVVDGTRVAWCRMYGSWAELRDGYSKSLWRAFGGGAGAVAVLTLMVWLFVAPPLLFAWGVARRRTDVALCGAVGYAAGVASRAVSARRTGGRVGDTLAHPVSVLALAWLTVRSFALRRAGRLGWRGRPVEAANT